MTLFIDAYLYVHEFWVVYCIEEMLLIFFKNRNVITFF